MSLYKYDDMGHITRGLCLYVNSFVNHWSLWFVYSCFVDLYSHVCDVTLIFLLCYIHYHVISMVGYVGYIICHFMVYINYHLIYIVSYIF